MVDPELIKRQTYVFRGDPDAVPLTPTPGIYTFVEQIRLHGLDPFAYFEREEVVKSAE